MDIATAEAPGKLRRRPVDFPEPRESKTLTILGKNKNIYLQLPIPGSVDQLVDVMRHQYNRPLPAADLLLINAYSELMTDVTGAKDLGSGVIGGAECDHLAFRGREVDWQIWIAQAAAPFRANT